MNLFKRIWNYLFPKKKEEYFDKIEPSKYEAPQKDAGKIIQLPKANKPHTQLFRNQQLPGKIYNIGKSRFRINKKLTETADGRLKYIITKLI